MKTLAKVMRHHVLLAVGAILLIVVVNVALLLGLVLYYGIVRQQGAAEFYGSQLAQAFVLENGQPTLPPEAMAAWGDGWAWAMLLDDAGRVTWRYQLPAALDHPYTASQIVRFSRWYLDDHPVLSYVNDYGVLVLGRAKGSVIRWNFYMDANMATLLLQSVRPVLLLDLVLAAAVALLMGWRSGRALGQIGQGIDALAQGRAPALPEQGMTAELAQLLNRTGALLQGQAQQLAQRDNARTQWIAGVSHDIRTPLALILGYAEQLAADPALPDTARQRAGAIARESGRIGSLIEDLNLTSKLQYGAQPLRRQPQRAGPLLRRVLAEFCNSPAAAGCTVDLLLSPKADAALLQVDAPLLRRALENLLNNSARHAPHPVAVTVQGALLGGCLVLTLQDDGPGYPPQVLAALQGLPEGALPAPHILGLHVVEQIAAAHGGRVCFDNAAPHGAKAVLTLPLAGGAEPRA